MLLPVVSEVVSSSDDDWQQTGDDNDAVEHGGEEWPMMQFLYCWLG